MSLVIQSDKSSESHGAVRTDGGGWGRRGREREREGGGRKKGENGRAKRKI